MPAWSRILTLPSEVKAITDDDGTRHVEGYVSSGREDRQGEVVHQDALLRAYDAAGGLPYFRDHNPDRAIGHVTEWEKHAGKVRIRATIVPPEGAGGKSSRARQDADDLFDLLALGTPASQSIGFNPTDRADWDKSGDDVDGVWIWGGEDGLKDFEMLETSAVMIGANRDADLHMAKGLGIDLPQPWIDEDAGLSKEEREEKRLISDLTRAANASEAARNYIRHLCKTGRTLSPEALEHVANPIAHLAEIVRAGRVLSARNREAVEAAIDALGNVLARDDASRERNTEDEKAALSVLDHEFKRSLLDLPVGRRD